MQVIYQGKKRVSSQQLVYKVLFTLYFVFLSTFLLALEETAFLFFVPCTFGALFYFCVDHDPSFGNIMTDGATISEHVRYMHVVYQKKKKKKKIHACVNSNVGRQMLPQNISQFLTQLATCLVRGDKKSNKSIFQCLYNFCTFSNGGKQDTDIVT